MSSFNYSQPSSSSDDMNHQVYKFNLPVDKINKINTLTQNEFTTSDKFVVINCGMGSGKTHQTIDYLVGKPSFI